MSNPTSNFGWQMPESTDLVTDLPADFEVFGQAVDTDFVDLLGGTTGQILSKTSATDLDFTWVAPTAGDIEGVTAGIGISGGGTSGTVTVTNSMATAIDAKGDLIVGTGADAFSRLAVGTNTYTLVADSAEATGLKWQAPAGASGLTLVKTQTIGTGVSTVTVTDAFSTTYENYIIIASGGAGNANQAIAFQLGSTTTGYYRLGFYMAYGNSTVNGQNADNGANYQIATTGANGYGFVAHILQPFTAKRTTIFAENAQLDTDGFINQSYGFLANTTSYTAFTIASASLTGGTLKIYGYQTS